MATYLLNPNLLSLSLSLSISLPYKPLPLFLYILPQFPIPKTLAAELALPEPSMDPKPASSSSPSPSTSKHFLSRGGSSSNSKQPKRQRSDGLSSSPTGKKSVSFNQFDIVTNFSNHVFAKNTKEVEKPSNVWTKKIHQDWKILKKDLPEAIFVRVCEERMDLLRAVIIGPAGTPYHDGLFFFDFQFTANYPNEPPKAYYHSGGLRLNPNLYSNGTVCLSLLNTWYGKGCEKWDPQRSTLFQILVSIQGLVLNTKPFFNEPGAWLLPWGKKSSLAYNESAFLLSCRTMMYSLRKPPMHFEEFVADHFRKHGISILMACRAYSNGTMVGCAVGGSENVVIKGKRGCSEEFKTKVRNLIDQLLKEFTARGVDCKEFLTQKAESGDASALPKESTSSLKGFCQYLLKLGKKVLPNEN